jgi:clathrin heavy chain
MAQQGPIPIQFTEALNLPALGIPSDNIKFGTCSMESDKYICVCEKGADGSSNVVIVDMTQGNTVTRRPISAEAAIMNPVSKVLTIMLECFVPATFIVFQ